jgi:hypothetical protein
MTAGAAAGLSVTKKERDQRGRSESIVRLRGRGVDATKERL